MFVCLHLSIWRFILRVFQTSCGRYRNFSIAIFTAVPLNQILLKDAVLHSQKARFTQKAEYRNTLTSTGACKHTWNRLSKSIIYCCQGNRERSKFSSQSDAYNAEAIRQFMEPRDNLFSPCFVPIRTKWSTYLTILDLINLIIFPFHEESKWWFESELLFNVYEFIRRKWIFAGVKLLSITSTFNVLVSRRCIFQYSDNWSPLRINKLSLHSISKINSQCNKIFVHCLTNIPVKLKTKQYTRNAWLTQGTRTFVHLLIYVK